MVRSEGVWFGRGYVIAATLPQTLKEIAMEHSVRCWNEIKCLKRTPEIYRNCKRFSFEVSDLVRAKKANSQRTA